LSRRPVLLKLGGSVITVKDAPHTANLDAIRRLAGEIAEADVKPLVIIHGGGSFGHPTAKRYGLVGGYKSRGQLRGVAETHLAMLTLNRLVVDALLEAGVPAVPVSPLSSVVTRGGRMHVMELEPLKLLLNLGFVPVLYGDVVMDEELGFTILSGDQLIARLAVELNARRVVVGVDVDGLYTEDPKKSPDAKLVQRITPGEFEAVLPYAGGSAAEDVTGGMVGKVRELLWAAERGIPIQIVNASKPRIIFKALRGEETPGTLIEPRRSG